MPRAPKIRYFISGHGYGHATRSTLIIDTLRRLDPTLRLDIVSAVPPHFLGRQLAGPVLQRQRALDVGVLQSDSLAAIDLIETAGACQRLLRRRNEIVRSEARRLVCDGIDLVVSDVPWLPCEAAAHAGIPAIGVSNFGWDLIYQDFATRMPVFARIAAAVRNGYREALLLQLPFGPSATAFARSEPMPLVARHGRWSRTEVRQRLGLSRDRKVALLSFGGFGLAVAAERLNRLRDWTFVSEQSLPNPPANLIQMEGQQWYYPDLLRGVDVVITKPGYGIVSEAIANHCRVLYARRHFFCEEEYLIAALKRYCTAREISAEALRAGDWEEELQTLLESAPPQEAIASNGAMVVASHLLELARRNR